MIAADNNLLMDPGGQLRLLPDTVTDEMLSKREISQGVCTGDQLKHSDPALYETVINLLADGSLSQRQISRLTGVSRNLIAGILRSQTSDIEPLKQRIAAGARTLAQLCIERATEMVLDDHAKHNLRDLMIAAGVAADKSLVLAGQASSIVEFRGADPSDDEFAQALRKARRVDCVDVGEEMGLIGEDSAAKGGPVLGDPAPGAQRGGAGSGVSCD
jgi:transcriptional regulator with XRE-family HTH domain